MTEFAMKPPRMLDIEEMWKESGLWAAKDITVPLINFYLCVYQNYNSVAATDPLTTYLRLSDNSH